MIHNHNKTNRLTALKGGRIMYELLKDFAPTYPIIAPADTSYPFIIYRRSNFTTSDTKDLVYVITLSYEIIIATLNYDDGVDISQRCWERLENLNGEIKGLDVSEIRITGATEDAANDAYLQRMTVEIDVLNV